MNENDVTQSSKTQEVNPPPEKQIVAIAVYEERTPARVTSRRFFRVFPPSTPVGEICIEWAKSNETGNVTDPRKGLFLASVQIVLED